MSDLLNISYKEAMEQLEQIIQDLESGSIEIDQLDVTIERARAILKYCEEKLRNIESKMEKAGK